ncbi:hypothetical protein ACA910_005228 [Epithemia clementina (nom. ined.)]
MHLSSIGIGDVFLEATTFLPSAYLSSAAAVPSFTSSCCRVVTAATTATASNQVKRVMFSREICGKIKRRAQDFIVREIALPGRYIPSMTDAEIEATRVASIDNTTTDTATSSDVKQPSNQDFALLDILVPQAKKRKVGESGSADPTGLVEKDIDATTQTLTTSIDLPEQNTPQPSSNDIQHEQHPLEILKTILTKTLQNHNSNGASAAKEILDSIGTLQQDLVEAIRQAHASQSSSGGGVTPNGEEKPSFSASALANSVGLFRVPALFTSGPAERGELHRAVRAAFPLLESENDKDNNKNNNSKDTYNGDEGDGALSGYRIKIFPDPTFLPLVPLLFEPHVDLPPLYAFYRGRVNGEAAGASSSNHKKASKQKSHRVILRLPPNLERKARAPLHGILSSQSRMLFKSNTLNDYPLYPGMERPEKTSAIVVSWSKNAKAQTERKRSREVRRQGNDCSNSLVVVRKNNVDHVTARNMLVSALQCHRTDVTFAGRKDSRAITEQFCTIRARSPEQVARAVQENINGKDLELGQAVKVPWLLNAGDLTGNRFEVTVRNVRRISVAFDSDGTAKEEMVPCDGHHLCECVERIRRTGFINFFGEQRLGLAGDRSMVGVRAFEIGRAVLSEKYSEAIDLIIAGREICGDLQQEDENTRQARKSWIERGRDPEVTSKLLPKSGYMAKERAVLNGLKRYRGDAAAAIQSLSQEDLGFWISTYQSYLWNLAATERIKLYGSQRAVPGDLVRPRASEWPYVWKEGMGEMDISSVVLPLPGTNTLFPENEVGDFLHATLKADGVDIRKQGLGSRHGAYRYLIAPAANLNYRVVDGKSVVDSSLWRNVTFMFDLPTGSFATMMLRELMTTTVARDLVPDGSNINEIQSQSVEENTLGSDDIKTSCAALQQS